MLSKTTQQTIRMGVNPITRRYRSFGIDPNENRVAGQWGITSKTNISPPILYLSSFKIYPHLRMTVQSLFQWHVRQYAY